ncbi:hypothetical protein HJC23_006112 [Cyclotella cryptica]|uniref:Uncharacterized protein n=1 Tax=Cyclotella cryptica TaxID=29204 RepID=A0ABD3QJS2_9STRA|eukprot:CCRYP_004586-RA/>CCRYP_004586-RA protein AED:0.00 eAED:0.00 QI:144/-1/1/1/-1/1/1/862/443
MSTHRRPALRTATRNSTIIETVFLVGLVVVIAVVFYTYQIISSSIEGKQHDAADISFPLNLPKPPSFSDQLTLRDLHDTPTRGGYGHFSRLAQDLASLPPNETLQKLKDEDPFGTRTFDSLLLEQETQLARVLTLQEIRQLFPCPDEQDRITLPDSRNEQRAREFRENKRGTFLFFQHLRKAGGTNFCSLAEKNLPPPAKPRYYCMPDMEWTDNQRAGYLHDWSNEEIIRRMESSGYRIAGNEWENFDVARHFELPAVFATSFRKPLDRALSQFRFECIEDRGCKIKDVHRWWDKRQDLYNVYTKTFADPPIGARQFFRGSYAKERRKFMETAIDTLSKFHLVICMEWLAYAGPLVTSVLGWDDLSALMTRVRPHIGQAKRDDGQDKNALGSASIKKASWVPEEYLDADQYKKMSEDLALDEILTDVARRMFLERLVCENWEQ